ncbi:MAG: hypothetical protein IE889_07050 [Campylobacterales bacterium]|nr:hypothetical protein [Campylobacterales bacterium]
MNYFSSLAKLFSIVFFLYTPLFADNTTDTEPLYDRVYRSDRIADSYHFFMMSKNGTFYYLHTNKASSLTVSELKSPNIIDILDKKQSWGQAFPSQGEYTQKSGKFYTQRYWDQIQILNSQKIKYLNKVFILQ